MSSKQTETTTGACEGSAPLQICPITADLGDGPWAGKIPEAASKEIKQAKGKVYEMTSDPWW